MNYRWSLFLYIYIYRDGGPHGKARWPLSWFHQSQLGSHCQRGPITLSESESCPPHERMMLAERKGPAEGLEVTSPRVTACHGFMRQAWLVTPRRRNKIISILNKRLFSGSPFAVKRRESTCNRVPDILVGSTVESSFGSFSGFSLSADSIHVAQQGWRRAVAFMVSRSRIYIFKRHNI